MTVWVLAISILLVSGQTAKIYRGVFSSLASCDEFMVTATNQMHPTNLVKSFSLKCAEATATLKNDK